MSVPKQPLEQWRPVPGYPGYEVSDLGRVMSYRRSRPKVLRQGVHPKGYLRVGLYGESRDGARYRYSPNTLTVHQLVMQAFVGPCPDGMEIRHLDGDPTNNALSNLRYGTHAENVADSIEHGTHTSLTPRCLLGHRLRGDNLIYDESGVAWCRTCSQAREAWRSRARA